MMEPKDVWFEIACRRGGAHAMGILETIEARRRDRLDLTPLFAALLYQLIEPHGA